MANSLLKTIARNSFADGIYKEILTRATRYYYFVGKTLPWTDVNNPPIVIDSKAYERETRNEIISMKEITPSDIAYVIPRVDWTTGLVYDTYDDQYSTEIQGLNLTAGGSVYSVAPTITIGTLVPVSTSVVLNAQYFYGSFLYTVTSAGTTTSVNTGLLGVIGTQYTHGTAKLTCVGIAATATCSIVDGIVTSTTMVVRGSGYTIAPAVSFTGSNTSSAVAVAVITKGVLGATKLEDTRYYVFNTFNVYICISNNNGAISTTAPTGTSNAPFGTADSYIWKYISTVQQNDKFLTLNYIPIVNASQNQYLANGSIASTIVENAGSGYVIASEIIPLLSTVAIGQKFYYNGYVYTVSVAGTTTNSYGSPTTVTGVTYTNGATFVCNGAITSLVVSGDGTGAALTPIITNGALVAVQINNAGTGYTYANVVVTGTGTAASVSISFTAGITQYSKQAQIESSTINGNICFAKVVSGGYGYSGTSSCPSLIVPLSTTVTLNATYYYNGYTYIVTVAGTTSSSYSGLGTITNTTYANGTATLKCTGAVPVLSVVGDGTGATAVVLSVVSGAITKIGFLNRGSNYNWANIVVTDSTGGTGASIRAIMSPYGGLGKDPINHLCARSLMLYSKLSNNTNQGLTVTNDYRQTGIIKDPLRYGDGTYMSANFASSCWKVTTNATISSISEDEILTVSSNSITYRFRVVSISGTNILLIPLDNGIPVIGMQFKNPAGVSLTATDVIPPIVDKYSGDMMFIDNESSFVATSGSAAVLRTVINF